MTTNDDRPAPEAPGERLRLLPLRQQAELALGLPPRERLELLLHAPKPMQLVRSLPDAELYLTVREVGPHDALPLLKLASAPQILHLLDLESWRRDRFDALRSGAWVALLLEAGDPTLRRFLRSADDELLVLLVQQWLRVKPIESDEPAEIHGTGLGETGDERGFVGPDGNYRLAPRIAEHVPVARRLLQMLFVEQPERYQRVLWAAVWELPAEVEERELSWRRSRLEEHGFVPWEEALDVYAPPTGVRQHPEPVDPDRPEGLAVPRSPLRVLAGRAALASAVERLEPGPRERALHEMVALANRLMVADSQDPGDPEAHRRMLLKAAGFVEIALAARGQDEEAAAARALREVPLIELFREGWSQAAELAGQADQLRRAGWAARHRQAIELLDTPLRERFEALLAPRPLYVDLRAGEGTTALRDFGTPRELEETRTALEMAETVGRLFVERLGVDVARVLAPGSAERALPPRFSTLLLTMLAWHAARGGTRLEPLPADVTADFLRTVASRRTAAPDAPARAMEALLDELARRGKLDSRERAVLGAFGKACLEQLAAECGGLDPGTPVDPRYVTCLLVSGERA